MGTKHTPGPWECCGDLIIGGNYTPANPKAQQHAYEIAKVAYSERNYPWIPQGETQRANASLIAAAPDLLTALRDLTEWGCTHTSPRDPNSPHELLIAARAAIAKAEGNAGDAEKRTEN